MLPPEIGRTITATTQLGGGAYAHPDRPFDMCCIPAAGAGTRLVTLHAAPQDTAITIPVERITAVALQSCEVLDDGNQGATPRVLTTAN